MLAKLNANGEPRRFWGVIPVTSGAELMDIGKRMEDVGFEGAFALQIYGPPFAPLAPVAAATGRLKIASGVAVAAARSPFETAYAAIDLDRISEGRFVLGLGTAVPSCTRDMFGAPDYKLLAHMRDTVAAVRHVIEGAHKGLQPYEGLYYQADYKEMIVTAPPLREKIPIWVAALRNKLTILALEVGDGLLAHALWTSSWTNDQMAPLIKSSLQQFGRSRKDIEISCWPWIAVNNDKRQAVDDSRPTVAAYAGIRDYQHIFEAHGFLEQAKICQQAARRQSDVMSVVDQVPDEMVLAFVSCGGVDEVLEQIEPFWNVADSLCPMTPYRHLTPEQLQFYAGGVYQLVAAARS